MKKLIIFIIAMVAIGYSAKSQTMITKLDNGDIRISCRYGNIQMPEEEYIAFVYFVQRIVEDQGYFTEVGKVSKTVAFPPSKESRYGYQIEFIYDRMYGFLVDDGNYVWVQPEELFGKMVKYAEGDNQ